jgi:voltage-gated sodium channel
MGRAQTPPYSFHQSPPVAGLPLTPGPNRNPRMPPPAAGRDPLRLLAGWRSARDGARRLVLWRGFQLFVAAMIVANAISLGLETSPAVTRLWGPELAAFSRTAVWIFVVEIALRVFAFGFRFFRSAWNLFDLAVVVVTMVPWLPNLSVLRALRVFRVLRVISIFPRLRRVVDAMLMAPPSIASILVIQASLYYVAAVLATHLFGARFDEWFGSIGRSMYSLFQIMTLESWSMGIVRPVMKEYPWVWMFFIPFIVCATFTVLNLFVAFLVSAAQAQEELAKSEALNQAAAASAAAGKAPVDEPATLAVEIARLRAEVQELRGPGPESSRLRPPNAATATANVEATFSFVSCTRRPA